MALRHSIKSQDISIKNSSYWLTLIKYFLSDIRAKQTHSINLDAVLEVTLSWNIDWENKVVAFHLKNAFDAIDKTYTWFAIGFSPRGKFPRTDLCFFQEGDENFVGSVSHKLSPYRFKNFRQK